MSRARAAAAGPVAWAMAAVAAPVVVPLVALALGGAAVLAGPERAQAQAQSGAQAQTRSGEGAPALAPGKAHFAQWCTPCHGPDPRLAGTLALQARHEGRLPAALEDRTDLTPALIAYFVRRGVAWMPPFRKTEISDEHLAQISAYLSAPLAERGAHAPQLAEEMLGKKGREGQ